MKEGYKKEASKINLFLFLITLSIFLVPLATAACECTQGSPCSPDIYDPVVTITQSTLDYGQSAQVNIKIESYEKYATLSCYSTFNSQTSSTQDIEPSKFKTFSWTVTAPTTKVSSQQSKTLQFTIYCSGSWWSLSCLGTQYVAGSKPASISYTYPLASTIQAQQQSSQASSDINTAKSLISSAQSEISAAQSKINEASKLGSDISYATSSLNSAQSSLTEANNYLSTAQSAYNSADYTTTSQKALQAQSSANAAKNYATQAKSNAEKLIEDWNNKKQEASNKISNANSAIDTAKAMIKKADDIINNATILGLDTVKAKADIAESRAKIEAAQNYYKEASTMFSANNFEGAKSKADLVISQANSAENLASSAYNSLAGIMAVQGESAKAILAANSEVSQMNNILTKMDYITRSVGKQGVDLNQTQAVVVEAKTNVDAAEDLLSQSKNRQDAGQFTEAVNYANQARDKAASSRNRLDTMTHTMSLSIQDALEKAEITLKQSIAQAEEEVASAQGTYGATADLIVAAQNDLASAKSKLTETQTLIQEVKAATGLTELVEKADIAFKSIDATQEKIKTAISNAKKAKMGLVQKVGIGAAVVTGIVGGGFLYYRQKKKKKLGKVEKKKEKVKEKPKKRIVKKK